MATGAQCERHQLLTWGRPAVRSLARGQAAAIRSRTSEPDVRLLGGAAQEVWSRRGRGSTRGSCTDLAGLDHLRIAGRPRIETRDATARSGVPLPLFGFGLGCAPGAPDRVHARRHQQGKNEVWMPQGFSPDSWSRALGDDPRRLTLWRHLAAAAGGGQPVGSPCPSTGTLRPVEGGVPEGGTEPAGKEPAPVDGTRARGVVDRHSRFR